MCGAKKMVSPKVKSMFLALEVYRFPMAAVIIINYHKSSVNTNFLSCSSGGQKPATPPWAKIKMFQGYVPFWRL